MRIVGTTQPRHQQLTHQAVPLPEGVPSRADADAALPQKLPDLDQPYPLVYLVTLLLLLFDIDTDDVDVDVCVSNCFLFKARVKTSIATAVVVLLLFEPPPPIVDIVCRSLSSSSIFCS